MKRVSKLITAVAVALGIGVAMPTQAEITLNSGGKGDALLFPVFNGTLDNHFAILNDSDYWIQGHLRFRGAGWSGELLDLDVILSPHDVLEFRVADVDGDGYWELDQSLDPKNFRYTGILRNCVSEVSGTVVPDCLDQNPLLIPPVGGSVTQALINYHRQWGYVEFIGEGVLGEEIFNGEQWVTIFGMSHATMENLINPTNAGKLAAQGQLRVLGKLGTHLWSWTDADKARGGDDKNATADDKKKLDVPNVLSGTAFVTMPGASHGLSYNAEALKNFRTASSTASNPHRIDNYLPNQAVIIHDEDVGGKTYGTSPFGDYVYGFPFNAAGGGPGDDRQDEARLSFNTTWGPTLADGDDYNPIPTTEGVTRPVNGAGQDDWDQTLTHANPVKGPDNLNSIAEVEEAIRLTGQEYTNFYLDDLDNNNGDNIPNSLGTVCETDANCTSLMSHYYGLFPTKYFYGESVTLAADFDSYLNQTVSKLLGLQKVMGGNFWDTEENEGCPEWTITTSTGDDCQTSPCKPWEETTTTRRICRITFMMEGEIKTIASIKQELLGDQPPPLGVDFSHGKISMWPFGTKLKDFENSVGELPANDPGKLPLGSHPSTLATWPMLLYTFELEMTNQSQDNAFVHHWRMMHR